MKRLMLMAAMVLGLVATARAGESETMVADVMKASGAENWGKVTKIEFTFNVAQGEKTLRSTKHVWDVKKGTDTVVLPNGKTATADVTGANVDADAKEAFKLWTNDSYWLLMPLKLKDPGVNVSYEGEKDLDGKKYSVLHLSFGKVGMTSGDQYNLYIDPETKMVKHWDYMPAPDKKVSGTWEDYREFGGMKLSMDHKFADKRIWFTDVKVEK